MKSAKKVKAKAEAPIAVNLVESLGKGTKLFASAAPRPKAIHPSMDSLVVELGNGRKLFSEQAAVSVNDPVPATASWVNHFRDVLQQNQNGSPILLTPIPPSGRKEGLRGVSVLTGMGYEGVYLSFGSRQRSIKQKLAATGADCAKLWFVDSVSAGENATVEKDLRTFYLSSPVNLTELSVAVDAALGHLNNSKKFIWVDSLQDLLSFHSPAKVAKFASFFVDNLKVQGVNTTLLTLQPSTRQSAELHEIIEHLCDHELKIP